MQIVDMDLVLHRVPTELVGRAVDDAALHPAASHPHGEAERVMLAPVAAFAGRCASEFTAPDDERVIQHSARFEVLQKAGDGLVRRGAVVRQFLRQIAVLVPELAARAFVRFRVIDLHHPHAALHEPARHEALLAEGFRDLLIEAVEFLRLVGFAAHIERLGCLALHAEGQLERLDARAEARVLGPRGGVALVELAQPVELRALLGGGPARVGEIRDRVLQVAHEGALEFPRQKTAAPQRCALSGLRG